MRHFCRECGIEVDEFCAEHPSSIVDSAPDGGDEPVDDIEDQLQDARATWDGTQWVAREAKSVPAHADAKPFWSGAATLVHGTIPLEIAKEHALSEYQLDLLGGSRVWSGADLKGNAVNWAGRYASGRRAFIRRMKCDRRIFVQERLEGRRRVVEIWRRSDAPAQLVSAQEGRL